LGVWEFEKWMSKAKLVTRDTFHLEAEKVVSCEIECLVGFFRAIETQVDESDR
jgi:hypothetical protein